MTTRSLRNIRTASVIHRYSTASHLLMLVQELDFLMESSVITPERLAGIISLLPDQASTAAREVEFSQLSPAPTEAVPSMASPLPPFVTPSPQPSENYSDEKRQNPFPAPQQQQQPPPPPAYSHRYAQPLAFATAMYAYTPTDAGDLGLLPNDRVCVVEYTNGDWWKGRSVRTGLEGIFPAKYVTLDQGGSPSPLPSPAPPQPTYGNVPLEVSQGGPAPASPAPPGRIETHGKRFGKKLGDAAIFGAGASIGSKIVNTVF
ncbi:MAG: hypothetical protein M1815_005140 [Lichina confinis]|nr:MAG: hypothetical protein M1815_005140 [Lichina confinis]